MRLVAPSLMPGAMKNRTAFQAVRFSVVYTGFVPFDGNHRRWLSASSGAAVGRRSPAAIGRAYFAAAAGAVSVMPNSFFTAGLMSVSVVSLK